MCFSEINPFRIFLFKVQKSMIFKIIILIVILWNAIALTFNNPLYSKK